MDAEAGGGGGGAPTAPAATPPANAPAAGGQPAPAAGDPAAGGAISQEQMNLIAAREKRQGDQAGRAAERQAQADALGVPIEELDATLAEAKRLRDAATAAEQAKLSDADKAKQQAERERDEAKRMSETAEQVLRDTLVQSALVMAGAPRTGDAAKDAQTLADLTLIVGRVDADPKDQAAFMAAADEAVKGVKERYPQMFVAGTPGLPPAPGTTPPAPIPPGSAPSPGAMQRGAELARQTQAATVPAARPRSNNPFDVG